MSEDKKELKNEELCEGKKKLSIEELEKVTGGADKQPSCPIYQYRNYYKECTAPNKGTCKQCPGCELNL